MVYHLQLENQIVETNDHRSVLLGYINYHLSHLYHGDERMNRLKELRNYVDAEINKMEDLDKRTSAIAHL